MKRNFKYIGCLAISVAMFTSCGEGANTINTTVEADVEANNNASNDNNANLAKANEYLAEAMDVVATGGDNHKSHDDFGFSALNIVSDLSGEDVAYSNNEMFFCYDYDLDNRDGSYRRTINTWNQLYEIIEKANSAIEILKTLPESKEARIAKGQAYTARAMSYFWLINLWQQPLSVNPDAAGVPLVTDEVNRQERVSVKEIYEQILSDINLGYNNLRGYGYVNGKGSLSEYAAAGYYARILMFTGDYTKAADYAERAIAGGTLNCYSDMMSGFNSLSMPEAIYGVEVTSANSTGYASFFSHVDAYMNGYGGNEGYRKLVSSDLYDKIADNDVRKQWFGLNEEYNTLGVDFGYEIVRGFEKYIPCKFRDSSMCGTGSAYSSDLIFMRVAEMYLIAAEAHYLNGNQNKAREFLNELISTRIDGYSFQGSGKELYDEICLQKRIELWMEGSRLFDIKRRNESVDRSNGIDHATNLESVNAVAYTGHDYRLIYHIPSEEIANNPYITKTDDNK
jgi:tetratricopeptide (TPR) repeat protein